MFFQREDKEKNLSPFFKKSSAKHRQHPFKKGMSEHMVGFSLWRAVVFNHGLDSTNYKFQNYFKSAN